jgi:hypothetical protein
MIWVLRVFVRKKENREGFLLFAEREWTSGGVLAVRAFPSNITRNVTRGMDRLQKTFWAWIDLLFFFSLFCVSWVVTEKFVRSSQKQNKIKIKE